MTTSAVPLKALQDLVICPICLDYYKDPRLLPCSHTFCFLCITQLSSHNKQDSSDSSDDDSDSGADSKHTFRCPLKDGTTLEKARLTDLPVNRIAKTMVELFLTSYSKTEKHEYQSFCDSCSKNHIERWCLECSRQFCGTCVVAHSRIPTHFTVTIADRAACLCSQHTDRALKFWCKHCKLLLCSECSLHDDRHGQHQEAIEPIHKMTQAAQASAETRLQQLLCIEGNFESLRRFTGTVIQEQKDSYLKNYDDLNTQFDRLNQMVAERKKILSTQLEEHQATVMSRLNYVEVKAEHQLDRMKSRTGLGRRILDADNAIELLKINQYLSISCHEASLNYQELVAACRIEDVNFDYAQADMIPITRLLEAFGHMRQGQVRAISCPTVQQVNISEPNITAQRYYVGSFVFGYRFRLTQSIRLKCVLIQSTYKNTITVVLYDAQGIPQNEYACVSASDIVKWNAIPTEGAELKNGHSLLVRSEDQRGSIIYELNGSRLRRLNTNCTAASVSKRSKTRLTMSAFQRKERKIHITMIANDHRTPSRMRITNKKS